MHFLHWLLILLTRVWYTALSLNVSLGGHLYMYLQSMHIHNLPIGLRWTSISGSGIAFKELKQGGSTILRLTQHLLPWECLEVSDICTAQDRVETEWAESLYFWGNYLTNSFKYMQSTVWLMKALWSKWFASTPCKELAYLLSWRSKVDSHWSFIIRQLPKTERRIIMSIHDSYLHKTRSIIMLIWSDNRHWVRMKASTSKHWTLCNLLRQPVRLK